jgi:predicted house-cleaning noncanonical NTP pyrophosphatase (MazG superfamily)
VDATGVRPLRKRLRFKGTFIAPDGQGRWIHYQTVAPFDWGRSITQTEWLTEIARTTRRVSDHEKHPVTVMWFIDNDRRATPHRVLPWYHTESEIGAPKAAPRRKLTMASDFKIETTADWEELKSKVQAGTRIERVMLEPKDPNLVRNQRFARQLAEFASQHKIVIELAGAILSHAYFILQRFGAQVECIDLFGAEEEDVEYNKVVRDKIPDYIQRKGEMVEVVRLKGDALLAALRQKLVEESFEALDARSGDDLIAELADVQEVIDGICDALQVPKDQVDAEKAEKRKRRGGFKRGFLLKKTSTPHSLTKKPPDVDVPALLDATQEPSLIEQSAAIPANRPYRRPDSRTLGEDLEGLLTFETELNRIGIDKQSVVFQMPAGEGETRSLRVSIDLTRIRSSLRSQIRVRLEPSQMAMKLGADSQLELSFKEESDPNAETDSKDMPE